MENYDTKEEDLQKSKNENRSIMPNCDDLSYSNELMHQIYYNPSSARFRSLFFFSRNE
jgi:hypothetical protein